MEIDNKREFTIPTRNEVSQNNQAIFDSLQKGLGFVPNLYAYYAKNETALADYLALQNRKSTLTVVEREIINLVVSQVNNCQYCIPAHSAIARMLKISDEQIIHIRKAEIPNNKWDALAKAVKEIVISHGKPSHHVIDKLFVVGYTEANLIDIIMIIGDKIISNYLHGITQIPVDFPAATEID